MWLDKKMECRTLLPCFPAGSNPDKKYAVGENLTLMQLSIFMLSLKNRDVKVYTTVFTFFTDAN